MNTTKNDTAASSKNNASNSKIRSIIDLKKSYDTISSFNSSDTNANNGSFDGNLSGSFNSTNANIGCHCSNECEVLDLETKARNFFQEGLDCFDNDNISAAETKLLDSLEIFESLYGTSHIDVAQVHEVLGHLFVMKGDEIKSKHHYDSAFAISKVLTENDENIACFDQESKVPVYENRGAKVNVFNPQEVNKEQQDDNNDMVQFAAEIPNEYFGKLLPEESTTMKALEQKADDLFRQGNELTLSGQFEDALDTLHKSLQTKLLVHGANHIEVAMVHESLSAIYSEFGFDETAAYHQNAIMRIMEQLEKRLEEKDGKPEQKESFQKISNIRRIERTKKNTRAMAA